MKEIKINYDLPPVAVTSNGLIIGEWTEEGGAVFPPFSFEATVTFVRVVLEDGTEIEAGINP